MSDDELKITIEPDEVEPAAEVVVEPKAKNERAAELAKTVDPAEELKAQVNELNALKEERAADRKRAEEAERRAAALEQEAIAARQRASDSDFSTITTALEAAQAEHEQAQKDILAAKEAGDAKAEVVAITKLTAAQTTLLRLDEAKADAETRKKAPPQRDEAGRFAPKDPVEAYAQGRTEPTAAWIRAHPDYVTDRRKNDKLTAAHYDAVAEGYAPDSRRYFDHIEGYLGLNKVEAEASIEAKPAPKRAQAAPVAPTAAVANGGTAPSNEVKLSTREVKSATDGTLVWNYDDPNKKFKKGDPIGLQEFARRKQKMMQQGHYDKSLME
jgi:hypothetical protein